MNGDYDANVLKGIKIAVCNGMSKMTVLVAAEKANLFFGTDLFK